MTDKIDDRIFHNLCKLAQFGHRWMGSAGEDNARDFIAKALIDSGLDVDLQTFPYLAFDNAGSFFSFNGYHMACEPLAYSASTDEPLTAPLLYAVRRQPRIFRDWLKVGMT